VPLAALLVEPHPKAAPLRVVVLDVHRDRGTDAGESVDHEPDERAIAEPDDGRDVDAVDEFARLLCREHRRLPLLCDVPRPADWTRRVERDHLAHNQVVEEHPDRSEVLLHGWLREAPLQLLNIESDVDRLNLFEISHLFVLKPVEEINHGPVVRAPRVRVPDLCREEFDEAAGGLRPGLADQRGDAGVCAGSQLPLIFPYQFATHLVYDNVLYHTLYIQEGQGLDRRCTIDLVEVLYLTLKELRAHRGKTQADLADRLRLQQAAVSKLEARSDLYVSMLRSFIEALGGKMEINAVFSDEKLNITGFDNDEVVEALRSLVHQRCRIDPMPPDRIEDEFIVTSVSEDGNVTLEKVSNRQSLEIPVRRILEVLPKNSMSPPTLVLHGSLAWSAQKELWKFMLS